MRCACVISTECGLDSMMKCALTSWLITVELLNPTSVIRKADHAKELGLQSSQLSDQHDAVLPFQDKPLKNL